MRGALAAALVVSCAAVLHAQDVVCDPGDLEVVRLAFVGNRAFKSAVLADGIVTTPSSWARRHLGAFGPRRCLDRHAFRFDDDRLLIWYRRHG